MTYFLIASINSPTSPDRPRSMWSRWASTTLRDARMSAPGLIRSLTKSAYRCFMLKPLLSCDPIADYDCPFSLLVVVHLLDLRQREPDFFLRLVIVHEDGVVSLVLEKHSAFYAHVASFGAARASIASSGVSPVQRPGAGSASTASMTVIDQ